MVFKIYKNIIKVCFFMFFISHLMADKDLVMEKILAEVGISSIIEKSNDVIIDIYSINQTSIAGVQFEIEPKGLFTIDSIKGGRCANAGFELYSNKKGVLLGFSLSGKLIPKSKNNNIEDNILFSVYGKKNASLSNQTITLKTTLAGKSGKKINSKSNSYIYKKKIDLKK